jgi:integrase
VLGYALRMELVRENVIVAAGIRKDATRAAARDAAANRTRKHYTAMELSAIFASPIYSVAGWAPPRADFGQAWYWLPLLMYYTGARREELAQLATRDIKHDQEAGAYLSILDSDDDSDDGRSVKTTGSRRSIPLHADLIQLGFLDYAQRQLRDGQLFPLLARNPDGYYGANFGKRWAEYLREVVGLASPAKPAHGFRHTFKTLCRKANIPEDVNDAITGHSGGGFGRPRLRRDASIKHSQTLNALAVDSSVKLSQIPIEH